MGTMKALLDTCTLLWWWAKPDKLSPRVVALIRDPDNECFVSAISALEIATKHRIGKFPTAAPILSSWEERLGKDSLREICLTGRHCIKAGTLAGEHRDPFDRIIAAQSIAEQYPVLSPDQAIEDLGAERIW